MVIVWLQKISARSEKRQARPLRKEVMNQVIRSRTDWRERVVFRLAWKTASLLFEIAALTPNNFTMETDGTIILDWPVAPKDGEGGSSPRLAVRQDARAGCVRHYKAMEDTSRKRKAHEYY
ncbi:trans-sialidase [Trypanosoma cruzi]|nr:trans-sialidase [Trypanosoma cruzi]